jgi:hypothetical protein
MVVEFPTLTIVLYCDVLSYAHCRDNRYNWNTHFHDNEYMENVEFPQWQIVTTRETKHDIASLWQASSCRATRTAEGTDPRRLWIPEKVGCRLQEDVPSCSNDMAEEKHLQENSDPGELWTSEGIGHSRQEDDQKYKSVTAQGTQSQEIRPGQCRTRNPERMDVPQETLEGSRMQQWHKGLRSETELRGTKRMKNQGTRQQLCLKIESTSEEFVRKAFGLEFVKWETGMPSGLRKMRNCTLWRGRPPPKWEEKKLLGLGPENEYSGRRQQQS